MFKVAQNIHVWLPHKNSNAYFSKSIIITLLKGVSIYKVLVYLFSPANRSIQLLVKRKLEIEGVWKNTKRVPTSMMLKFGLATIYQSIYKRVLLDIL